jgi:hypothetical protein
VRAARVAVDRVFECVTGAPDDVEIGGKLMLECGMRIRTRRNDTDTLTTGSTWATCTGAGLDTASTYAPHRNA